MNPSPEKNDRLIFIWDSESVDSIKIKNRKKISSDTKYDLEEYFKFLEDMLPDPPIFTQKRLPINKVFELDT